MGKLFFSCQTPIYKGRNIMDGVMSLHEILYEAKRKKNNKIDFGKAYDKIDWDYLLKYVA
jgi:hypothetical protein